VESGADVISTFNSQRSTLESGIMLKLLLIYLAAMNLLLFALMGFDKARARRGQRRIPESTLFFFAVAGGSLGGVLGMAVFRHKTRHASFRIGFPAILLCQTALAVFLFLTRKGLIP